MIGIRRRKVLFYDFQKMLFGLTKRIMKNISYLYLKMIFLFGSNNDLKQVKNSQREIHCYVLGRNALETRSNGILIFNQ